MKILYLTADSFFKDQIIQSQVVNLLEEIAANYEDISLITLVTFDDVNEAIQRYKHDSDVIEHLIVRDNGHFSNLIWTLSYVIRNANKYDVIHVRSYQPMISALLAKFLYKTKVIFDPRGLFSEEISYYDNKIILGMIFKVLEKFFCKFSDCIVVVSEPFRQYIANRYKVSLEKILTIPTFLTPINNMKAPASVIDVKKDIFGIASLVFTYSGSFERWQLIEKVVDFFALTHDVMPDARFIFYTREVDKFNSYLKNRLPINIFHVMCIENKLLQYYLAQCDYGILLRDDNVVNTVSAPIKVKDYLVSGLPIIMSNNIGDSSKYVYENNLGLVLRELSPEEMKNKIQIIKDGSANFDKNEIATIATKSFNVNVIASKYHAIYNYLQSRDKRTL